MDDNKTSKDVASTIQIGTEIKHENGIIFSVTFSQKYAKITNVQDDSYPNRNECSNFEH